MKFYFITTVAMILFSSCLKQSIPDAMLALKNKGIITATLSYQINGNTVHLSVADADNQGLHYTIGCSKYQGYYSLDAMTNTGEFTFSFITDSLRVGNYKYTGAYGEMFFIDNNNTNEYVYAPSDSMSFNITSVNNGHISGNFSGALTPMVSAGTFNNVFGTPGSVLITNGSFKNIPVFY